ncbi:DNA polymerase III subunit gamma/tau [Candidatus Peregrinibacteria bacterium]|jgi:DNA polymerase III subunit gamma/tau|nr:DNA polymerase III subunit gamma/tau [Candidatus Peregrinibacteria bacterium]
MSLYLKYRPHDFGNLVGQEHITLTLQNALKEDRVSQAYLFCGPRGTGKTSMARLIAKALNCLNRKENGDPCNECDICQQINANRLTDIIEIDAASNRGIDEIRDLREKIKFSPNIAKYKVYIIDEVHMLTKEAFNALLKTLEEPPSHAYFILATTESYKVPETIISRCQRFDFHRMSRAVLIERLKFISEQEKIHFEVEALECIAERVNGGMRDAIGLLEQSTQSNVLNLEYLQSTLGLTQNQSIVDLFNAIYERRLSDALSSINKIHNQGFDLTQLSKDFLEYARKEMLSSVENGDKARTSNIVHIIDLVQDAKEKIKNSSLPQLALEIAAIKICGAATGPVVENIAAPEVRQNAPVNSSPAATNEEYSTTLKDLTTGDENDLLTKLRKNWLGLVTKIKNPAIRVSFRDAKAVSITDNRLLLHFSTQFHLDKTASAEAMGEIEDVIENTYGARLGIKTELRKVDLEPAIREHSSLGGTQGSVAPQKKTVEENPEDALNVFESW